MRISVDIARVLVSIRDSVHRVLSDESQASLPTNVITEREYLYDMNIHMAIALSCQIMITPQI